MKFRRQSKADDTINLTPLIDVVFLLLIFFTISTTLKKETQLSIDLPEASGEKPVVVSEQIQVLINRSGDYAINGESLVNNELATLKKALSDVSLGNSDLPLLITADAQTSHEAVVRAMDAAGQLGFIKLSITTTKPPAEP